jgi:putative ATPase
VVGQSSLFGADPDGPADDAAELNPSDPSRHAPLATRMRPRTFEEFVGQHRAIGAGTVLRRAVDSGEVPSLILWGPPGTGKTTLAVLIAGASGAAFEAVSATSAGVADLRKVVERARERLRTGRRTVLFIDEIHRFNKSQQDAVLPHVENATVTLLGATTENPSFEVNAALLSRSRVIRLEALEPDDLRALIGRALHDPERGLGAQRITVDPDAVDRLVALCGGDARIALNSLELAAQAASKDDDGEIRVTVADIEGALQSPALLYDRAGDQHYWLISAFIKSVRGSDPDAAVYWLARMLEAGEDPLFVARRMVISAAEDIGLADPHALGVAVAAQQAAHFIGMPEGFLPLAEAALYLASAPKSNSVLRAYVAASSDVAETLHQPVPLHLRNAVTGLGRAMGFGTGYRYAHDHEGGVVEQEHLPASLVGHRYFEPSVNGAERELSERLISVRETLQRRKDPS